MFYFNFCFCDFQMMLWNKDQALPHLSVRAPQLACTDQGVLILPQLIASLFLGPSLAPWLGAPPLSHHVWVATLWISLKCVPVSSWLLLADRYFLKKKQQEEVWFLLEGQAFEKSEQKNLLGLWGQGQLNSEEQKCKVLPSEYIVYIKGNKQIGIAYVVLVAEFALFSRDYVTVW